MPRWWQEQCKCSSHLQLPIGNTYVITVAYERGPIGDAWQSAKVIIPAPSDKGTMCHFSANCQCSYLTRVWCDPHSLMYYTEITTGFA